MHRAVAVLSLIVAFVIALTTGNMWVKTTTFVAQPSVRFKYDMLMVFEGARPGAEKVYTHYYDSAVGRCATHERALRALRSKIQGGLDSKWKKAWMAERIRSELLLHVMHAFGVVNWVQ